MVRRFAEVGMKRTITIGTRGSQLALWQAEYVRKRLNRQFPDLGVELQIIKTTGDVIQERSLVGLGKGVFTKEIEKAILAGAINLAVHSMKDLPTDLPDELCVAAIPVREDPRDVLVTQSGLVIDELASGAIIGTASPRRRTQLLHFRPDLRVVDVRGNIDTRLRKLRETNLDGIIVAAAGIKRLMGQETITEYFEINRMVPSPGQGALGIETREGDLEIKALLARINDCRSECEVRAERAVLRGLGGGCQVPIGANAELKGDNLHLTAAVCSPDGRHRILERVSGSARCADELASDIVIKLIQGGASKLLK